MASNTFTKIATVTVGSGGTSSIDFTSIPSTYTDLAIYFSGRQSTDDLAINMSFNNDTTSNIYSQRNIYGTGSATGSGNQTFSTLQPWATARSGATASVFGNTFIYIPNYTSSNYKSLSVDFVDENNGTAGYQAFTAGLWSKTNAITSIKLEPYNQATGKIVQYSSATLYGIKNS